MATVNTTDPKPGFVYNADDDTWYPLAGIATQSLDGLTDVIITSPTSGQTVVYNGTNWVNTAETGDISGVTAGTGLSGGGTSGAVTVSIDTAVTADLTTAQTLTNKTIDAASNTLTGVTTLTGTQTLTNKTLTSPAVTGGSISDTVVKGLEEDVNVVASAATGTINFDVTTASIWYYTTNATANHTLNFRYSSGTTLNDAMATGDAITLVWLNTNGVTPYYPNVIQVDGNAVTPKVPSAITGGNASSIDAYSFTIIKTANATFTVLESQTKFA
jgi:hypothetical protein